MLISYNWLKKYIDIDMPPIQLAETMNIAGLPVEEIIDKKPPFSNVFIARVLSVEKHPQADNLSLCDVTDGNETLKIVCGAPNVAAGQTVALAKIGAVLPGDIKIKKAKIRGIESSGMICSASELGFEKESPGIMVLDEKIYKTGEPYSPVKPDTIFNLEITPNRPDLLCVTGVARFLAARAGLKINYPSFDIKPGNINSSLDINSKLKIRGLDPGRCPRYTARLIEGVKIGDSPQWLKDAMAAMGTRPINNVVDVTNYVLFELNHPLHAFDYKKLKGAEIVIRTAKQGEKILALDTKTYAPGADDLVIADSSDPIALAGIMGGENFSVDPSTVSIVLESAFFSPASVRKTSRKLGVSSDSSYRFERGIDIENVHNALNRAVELIIEVAGGKASKNYIDIYPEKYKVKLIPLRFDRVNKILGTSLSSRDIREKIDKLQFPVRKSSNDSLDVEVPAYRVDISEEIDIIEDVAQIQGYDNIPSTLPCSGMTLGREPGISSFIKNLSRSLVNYGFSEVVNYSFLNNKLLKELKITSCTPENTVALKNPFHDDETHMKTTLLPDLIKNLITNYNNENENIHLFEASNIFFKSGADYTQLPRLGAVSYGSIIERGFNQKEFTTDFIYLKSVLAGIHSLLGTDAPLSFKPAESPSDIYEYYAVVSIGQKEIGTAGQLKQEILHDYKFKDNAFLFELDIQALYSLYNKNTRFSQISRFPVVKRDISVVVKDEVAHDRIETIIRSDNQALIRSITLFDLYKGNQVPEGCKSLSYNIIFQSRNKTLSEAEINKIMDRIIASLKSGVNAELRS